jgi:hypothetical protein
VYIFSAIRACGGMQKNAENAENKKSGVMRER